MGIFQWGKQWVPTLTDIQFREKEISRPSQQSVIISELKEGVEMGAVESKREMAHVG